MSKGAIANVSKSYIDSRASISTKDITRQYDLMTQAHSDYALAGGKQFDDELLQAYLLSSLPSAYENIKLNLRARTFDSVDTLFDALFSMCKQLEDDKFSDSATPGDRPPSTSRVMLPPGLHSPPGAGVQLNCQWQNLRSSSANREQEHCRHSPHLMSSVHASHLVS